ncbi:hypothetical protein NFI95_15575 [Acetobacteraceae bacterium KSS8]|uniref:Phage tail protein n=1 Tax=Endosaccharibacter trunci TaxID=2812733 RepID=A0ABT1WAE2_9PROT|nr:hypothetical protein [Acetobacteraceae bacterium KSS8]
MTETIIDSKGRAVEVRPLVGSKMSRFILACGPSYGEGLWSAMTMARASIASVDGVPAPPTPSTLEKVHLLWDAVDDEAAGAALDWLIARQKDTIADAKNSAAPQDSEAAPGS